MLGIRILIGATYLSWTDMLGCLWIPGYYNIGAAYLSANPIFLESTKHIEDGYHFFFVNG